MSETIQVEVAYALPEKQRVVKLEVAAGTTVLQAVTLSQLDEVFEELTLGPDLKLGVWGKSAAEDRVLVAGERVEIYRPLQVDPKEVRNARAARAKAGRVEGDQESEGATGSDSSA